jgi:hypothetical protein
LVVFYVQVSISHSYKSWLLQGGTKMHVSWQGDMGDLICSDVAIWMHRQCTKCCVTLKNSGWVNVRTLLK